MRKVNKKKCLLSLGIMVALVGGVMSVSHPTKANIVSPEDNIGLVIDKLAKDTLEVSLSNVSELLKSVQFSVVIEGDVSFDEDSFVPLVSGSREASSLANVVFSDDKKEATFYLVSNEAIAKDGGNIEVGQLKVKSLDNKPVKYAIKSRVAGDGTAYKYVVSTTNKQVSGPEMTLVDEGAITFNAVPTLTLIPSPQVVEGKIVLTVGDEFTEDMQKSFVLAADEEDSTLVDLSVSGVVNVNTVGSYMLTYQVTDSLGDKATLTVPVIVENKATETIENPKITGVKNEVKLVVGDDFDPLDGVLAVDYLGRQLEVILSGDYTNTVLDGVVTKAGIYTIFYDAQDRLGNVAAQGVTTLTVSKKSTDGDDGSGEGNPGDGNNGSGEGNPGDGNNGSGEGNPGDGNNGSGEGNPGDGNNGSGGGNPGDGNNGSGEGNPGDGNNGSGEDKPGSGNGGTTGDKPGSDNFETTVNTATSKQPTTGYKVLGVVVIGVCLVGAGAVLWTKEKQKENE